MKYYIGLLLVLLINSLSAQDFDPEMNQLEYTIKIQMKKGEALEVSDVK